MYNQQKWCHLKALCFVAEVYIMWYSLNLCNMWSSGKDWTYRASKPQHDGKNLVYFQCQSNCWIFVVKPVKTGHNFLDSEGLECITFNFKYIFFSLFSKKHQWLHSSCCIQFEEMCFWHRSADKGISAVIFMLQTQIILIF